MCRNIAIFHLEMVFNLGKVPVTKRKVQQSYVRWYYYIKRLLRFSKKFGHHILGFLSGFIINLSFFL